MREHRPDVVVEDLNKLPFYSPLILSGSVGGADASFVARFDFSGGGVADCGADLVGGEVDSVGVSALLFSVVRSFNEG